MSNSRPELIFIAGPQQGERAVLMANRVVAGRGSTCEINLKEDFASRQQFVFELTRGGWTMENLSTNGTRINGKKYKTGQKLQLATGDILGIGIDTLILYVAPDDDPEQALADYRKANAKFAGPETPQEAAAPDSQQTPPQVIAPPNGNLPPLQLKMDDVVAGKDKTPPADPRWPAVSDGRAMHGRETQKPADEPTQEDAANAAAIADAAVKKSTRRKVILAIVCGSSMFALLLAVLLSSGPTEETNAPKSLPALLTHEDIEKALLAPLPRPTRPDKVKSDKALEEAQALFPRRAADLGNRYKVVDYYKTYIAYKEGPAVFDNAQQEKQFKDACEELVNDVFKIYDNAYSLERNKNWKRAETEFSKLMTIVPERDSNVPAYSVFISNILEHSIYISQQQALLKKKEL